MARRPGYPGIKTKIGYVTKLYEEEIHVLARPDIKTLADLGRKPVAFGALGSGHRITAENLFQVLKIPEN